MTEIKGVIKAYSHSEGKSPGIMVNDKWYNAAKGTENIFIEKLKDAKGYEVTLNLNDKGYVETFSLGEKTETQSSFPKREYKDNSEGMRIGMAVNNATNIMIARLGEQKPTAKDLADAIVLQAKALLTAMEEHGLK